MGFAGRRNDAGYTAVGDDIFKRDLGPTGAADLLGPIGQFAIRDAGEQFVLAERPIDQRRNPVIGAKGQQIFLGGAFDCRIGELAKIHVRMFDDGFFQIVERIGRIMGDAHIADAPLVLPVAQGGEMGVGIDQIVDLHERDGRRAQTAQ